MERTGPSPITSGSIPETACETIRAKGVQPFSRAESSVVSTQ